MLFNLVAIDILSGLPTSPDGHKYLLVAADYLTRLLEAIPLCDAEASTCMRALYSAFFSRFGLPNQLHSDQGSNFESKLVAELCLITGINKTRTTPFHPHSDGQTERANRTILQMLRASIDEPFRTSQVLAWTPASASRCLLRLPFAVACLCRGLANSSNETNKTLESSADARQGADEFPRWLRDLGNAKSLLLLYFPHFSGISRLQLTATIYYVTTIFSIKIQLVDNSVLLAF